MKKVAIFTGSALNTVGIVEIRAVGAVKWNWAKLASSYSIISIISSWAEEPAHIKQKIFESVCRGTRKTVLSTSSETS